MARIREVFSPKRTEHESEVLEEEEKPIPIPYDPVFALPKVTEDAVEAFMMGERREGGRESAGTTTAGQKRRGSSASGSRKRRKSLGS